MTRPTPSTLDEGRRPGTSPEGGGPRAVPDAAQPPPEPGALGPWLLRLADRYETPAFLDHDPLGMVRAFDDPDDRERFGLFAALLAWGRRDVLRRKLAELAERMDGRPAAFVRAATPARAEAALRGFVHRTFSSDDAVALTLALRAVTDAHGSLGALAARLAAPAADDVGPVIEGLSGALLGAPTGVPVRPKHLARPSRGSAAKRLAMYVRWMTRPGPVDLGLWAGVPRERLVVPLDVHTGRQGRRLGLLARATDDWRAAAELTAACRRIAPDDPARLDFALFGLGAWGGHAIPPA